jgi:hypothetical protein
MTLAKPTTKPHGSKEKRGFVRRAISFFRIISCRGRHETDDFAEERFQQEGSRKQTSLSAGLTFDFLTDRARDEDFDNLKKTTPKDESLAQVIPAMEDENGVDDVCPTCERRPCKC